MMSKDQKLRMLLRSVLRAGEALVSSEPFNRDFQDRLKALEEACIEGRELLRIIDNEEHAFPNSASTAGRVAVLPPGESLPAGEGTDEAP